MIVGIYVRVSTAEQAKEGYSVKEQTERLTKYAEAHGWHIYKIYADPGYSGSNMNRPALQQMIDDVRKRAFEKLIVFKLDRLSRSQKDTLTIIEDILLANNVDFSSMQENFDTSTPFGKAIIGMLAVFAQLEREQIKERMNMGREARAKEGYYTGGRIYPYGYDYVDGELVINEYEAMAVRRIFELTLQDKASWTICKILEAEGYIPRHKVWVYQTVQKIQTSRIYIGEVSFSKKWYKGRHTPLISKEDFDAAQEILNKKRKKFSENITNYGRAKSYLAGIVYCGRCGQKFYKQSNSTSKGGKLLRVYYYKCFGRTNYRQMHTPQCRNTIYPMDKLDAMIFEEIRKLALEPAYFKKVKKKEVKSKDDSKIINSEIEKIDSQISNLLDLYACGSMPLTILDGKVKDLDQKKTALKNQLALSQDDKASKKKMKQIESTITMIPDILDHGSFDEIRKLVTLLIEKIVIDGEDIEIHWNF